jgi:CubicO group peptidase (beta-lactamase class C family)
MNRLTRSLVACCFCAGLLSALACEGADTNRTAAPPPPTEAAPPVTEPPAAPSLDEETQRQPSFRQFSAWLEAFNSGNRDQYATFLADHFPARLRAVVGGPKGVLDGEMGFRELTGGFDLRKLEQVSADEVSGLLQERASDQFAHFELAVEAGEPYEIIYLDLRAIPRPAEFAIERLTEGEAISALDARLREDAAADRFSGAVLVAKDGRALFSKVYGLADREQGIPNTLETRFRIGSMNKMLTAVAILQLVEAAKIDLEAPLGTYLTDYLNRDVASKVTVHDLLTHTGGTGDIFGPEFDANRNDLRTHADYVELYGKRGLEFEPGSQWAYSNYGFVLLGAVIEAASGQSYYDYVRKHIYEPAGMTRTGSAPEDRAVPDRSIGYMMGATGWVPNTDTLPYRGTSAGGGYSTVEDLERFADALLSHELLRPESTELLITAKVVGLGSTYAYGFDDRRGADGNGWVGHGGGAPGMNGDLRIYPESGYVVAVLANLDPPAAQRISEYLDPRLPLE